MTAAPPPGCGKEPFRSREAARERARLVTRRCRDGGRYSAYRCRSCVLPGGGAAWHWGHLHGRWHGWRR